MTAPARLPRGAGPASPAAVGRVLLTWVEAWWADRADPDNPDAPQPLPAARYMAAGDPRTVAWDNDTGQVTVACDRLVMGLSPVSTQITARTPRANPANAGRLNRHAVYEVQIVRPAPGLSYSGAIPDGSVLDAHGYLTMTELGHLLTCLADGLREGTFLREHVGQAEAILGDGESLGPSGALVGIACGLTIPLL